MAPSSGKFDDDPADRRLGASGRPDGADDELGLPGASGGVTAVVPANPSACSDPGLRERGRFREPAQVLPRAARDGARVRTAAPGMNTIDSVG